MLGWIMNLGFAASASTVAAAAGPPYDVQAGDLFIAGGMAAELFIAGGSAGESFVAGGTIGEIDV